MATAKTGSVDSYAKLSPSEKLALDSLKAGRFVERIWQKDATLWKKGSPEAKAIIENALGWLTVPAFMQGKLTELNGFREEVLEAGFTDVVVLGMGGSSLAPFVFAESFASDGDYPKLHILDSTDPRTIRELQSKLDITNTLFIVASKSGSTIEPNTFFEHFRSLVKNIKGDRYGENFVAITDSGSSLEALAKESAFRRTFINPSDIGGRYSALSYFGLLPAALSGVDVERILKSADAMVRASSASVDTGSNHAILLGVTLGVFAKEGRDKVTFFISEKIKSFGLWIEQLLAESTGKEGLGLVPIVDEPLTDIKNYGNDRVFVFIGLKGSPIGGPDIDGLKSAGHPVVELALDSEYSIGAEFFMWEFATAVVGSVLGINPFDQPNVESAKISTRELLDTIEEGGDRGSTSPYLEADGFEIYLGAKTRESLDLGSKVAEGVEVILKALFKEEADYSGILAYLNPYDRDIHRELQGMRRVFTSKAIASHFGYGPRYLHSSGQLHKGGGGGVFIIITNSITGGEDDIAVPGRRYSFGELESSQAMGDLAAIDGSGKRAILIDIRADDVPSKIKELTALLAKII